MQEHTKNLNQLLEKVTFPKKTEKIYHVGHSLGGTIALGYARQFASEVEGIILLDPLLSLPNENYLSLFQSSLNNFGIFTKLGLNRVASALQLFKMPPTSPEYHDLINMFTMQDKFATSVTWELNSLTNMIRDVQQNTLKSTRFAWVTSDQAPAGFSVISDDALHLFVNSDKKIIEVLKKDNDVVEYSISGSNHLQLPFSAQLFQIISDFTKN